MSEPFHGKGYTHQRQKHVITTDITYFGGRTIPAGSETKQFETRNFGWIIWKEPNGAVHVARE